MKLFILLLPIIIALLISIKLLFFHKNKTISFKILGAYLLLFTIVLFAILMQYQRQYFGNIKNYMTPISIALYISIISLPPTVYFYISSLTDNLKKYTSFDKVIPHYTFTILLLIINIFSIIYLNLEEDYNAVAYKLCKEIWNQSNFVALLFIFPVLNVFYLYRSFKIYFEHRKKVKEVFSYDEGVSLKWMLIFLFGYILYVISFYALDQNSSPILVYIPIFLYLMFIGFMGSKQKKVTTNDVINELEANEKQPILNQVKREELKEKITHMMNIEKPYVDSQLTVYQLAKLLGTNSAYLSSILNSDFNLNFTSFINSYRIEESKRLFESSENKNFTIEAIGSMAGFKSKSAFNRWFKELTGTTPSAYIKRS